MLSGDGLVPAGCLQWGGSRLPGNRLAVHPAAVGQLEQQENTGCGVVAVWHTDINEHIYWFLQQTNYKVMLRTTPTKHVPKRTKVFCSEPPSFLIRKGIF